MPAENSLQELLTTLLNDRILRKYRFDIQNNLNDFAYQFSQLEGKRLLDATPLNEKTIDMLLDKIPDIVDHDIVLTINGALFLAHICFITSVPDLAQKPLSYALELCIKVFTQNRGNSTQMSTEDRRDLLNKNEPIVYGIVNFLSKAGEVPVDNELQAETFIEGGLLLIECARQTALETGIPLNVLSKNNNGKLINNHERISIDHNSKSFQKGLRLLSDGYSLAKKHNINPDRIIPLANHIINTAKSLLIPDKDPDNRAKKLSLAQEVARKVENNKFFCTVTGELSALYRGDKAAGTAEEILIAALTWEKLHDDQIKKLKRELALAYKEQGKGEKAAAIEKELQNL